MFDKLKEFGYFDDLIRRPPFLYLGFRRLLATAEGWGREEREAWLKKRLAQELVAARELPGYRNAPITDDLSAWPILNKSDIFGRESEFGRAAILPSYRASTGGTTGMPLALRRSLTSIAFEQASIDHICAMAGLDLARARIAILRGDFVKPPSEMAPPYWRSIGARKRLYSSFHLSEKTLPHYADSLREFAPDVLSCYPSSLQHLVGLLEESGKALRIGHIFASSELLPRETVAAARRVLGACVIDYYGQAERVVVAYAIDGGGYRFLPVYGVPELVPDEGDSVRVRGTSLWNERQILIRYETGDNALLDGEERKHRREIELGLMPFRGIEGRASERIDLPDGRRIIGLNHIPRGVPGIASVQLCHVGPNTVDAYVVPLKNFGPETEAILRRNFYAKFPSEVVFRVLKINAPLRNTSGKAPFLITKA
jgi:phenylacetate-CoA ligase